MTEKWLEQIVMRRPLAGFARLRDRGWWCSLVMKGDRWVWTLKRGERELHGDRRRLANAMLDACAEAFMEDFDAEA